MKRDINLVKEILLIIEDSPTIQTSIDLSDSSPINGYDTLQISYHLRLLHEAGYIKGNMILPEGTEVYYIAFLEMTWAGHEFLQILKDKEILSKITKLSKDGITNLSFDLVKDIAKKLIQTKAEKYLGIS